MNEKHTNKKYIIICQSGRTEKLMPYYTNTYDEALIYREELYQVNPTIPVEFIIKDLDLSPYAK